MKLTKKNTGAKSAGDPLGKENLARLRSSLTGEWEKCFIRALDEFVERTTGTDELDALLKQAKGLLGQESENAGIAVLDLLKSVIIKAWETGVHQSLGDPQFAELLKSALQLAVDLDNTRFFVEIGKAFSRPAGENKPGVDKIDKRLFGYWTVPPAEGWPPLSEFSDKALCEFFQLTGCNQETLDSLRKRRQRLNLPKAKRPLVTGVFIASSGGIQFCAKHPFLMLKLPNGELCTLKFRNAKQRDAFDEGLRIQGARAAVAAKRNVRPKWTN